MPASVSWMIKRLDAETRPYHALADEERIALLTTTPDRERYTDYLARMYASEAPIEQRWRATRKLGHAIDLESRLHTPALAIDLAWLGRDADPTDAPPYVDIPEALGWMYAVERGRLLHGMMHRYVGTYLRETIERSGEYLLSSSTLGGRWESLERALEHHADSPAIAAQIVAAALEAFRQLCEARRAAAA